MLTETEEATWGLYCSAPGPLHKGDWKQVCPILLPALWTLFPLLGSLVQSQESNLCLVLQYFVWSCLFVVSWRPILFYRKREVEYICWKAGERGWKQKNRGRRNCGCAVLYERNLFPIKTLRYPK